MNLKKKYVFLNKIVFVCDCNFPKQYENKNLLFGCKEWESIISTDLNREMRTHYMQYWNGKIISESVLLEYNA